MSDDLKDGWDFNEPGSRSKLSRKERWRMYSLLLMVISFGLLLVLAVHNHRKAAEDPKFCANCHEMQENYDAWQTTSHSKVSCLECHKNVSIAGNLYKQLVGVNRVKELKVTIDDQACSKCHGETRVITPPMDLLIPHNMHVQIGLSCTQCHSNITHGSTVINNQTDSSSVVTAQQGNLTLSRVPMTGCMRCHNGVKASADCAACHANKIPPASHTTAGFKTEHGFAALSDIGSCNKCHQYDVALQQAYKPKDKSWNEVQSFARSTDFCSQCHGNRPQTHQSLYTVNHGPAARQDPNGCLTCHNQDDKGKVQQKPATNVTCVQCHYSQHPADFLKLHPKQVDKTTQAKCFSCHDAASCNDCHNKTLRVKS